MKDKYFCGSMELSQEGVFTINYSPKLKDALLRRLVSPQL